MNARAWLRDVLHFALPAGCAACGVWIPGGAGAPLVCGRCRSRLRPPPAPTCTRCHFPLGTGRQGAGEERVCRACAAWPPALAGARAAFLLEGPARELVHAFKYEGWASLARPMAGWMARRALPDGPGGSGPRVVTHVPTTRRRARRRGYDQARLLAEAYARAVGLPFRPLLLRAWGRRSQTGLHPDERRRNVRGAFQPAPGAGPHARAARIVLVDDVLTTGATAAEAAAALAGAGAVSVTLVTFARAWPEGLGHRDEALS